MTYSSLMVHLDLYQPNEAVLRIAGALAKQFNARIIGVAAWQPMQAIYTDGYLDAEIFEQDRAYVEQGLKEAEAQFRAVMQGQARELEWRAALPIFATDYVAHQARSADLVILGGNSKKTAQDKSRRLDAGDFVMRAGRPVLIVPPECATQTAETVVVAWKDTREARRATLDAMPLLKKARSVAIVEAAREDELSAADAHVKDVAAWLKSHDVVAECVTALSDGDDSEQIRTIAQKRGADLVVAGAYGHSRLREWAFGGVTHDLLQRTERCSLISH